MANYAVSDVAHILGDREWQSWDELIGSLEKEQPDATAGLSARDKDELLRDLRRARDDGQELVTKPGELYRAIMSE
jgi:hypothetical protein